jgi:hypothetical protein
MKLIIAVALAAILLVAACDNADELRAREVATRLAYVDALSAWDAAHDAVFDYETTHANYNTPEHDALLEEYEAAEAAHDAAWADVYDAVYARAKAEGVASRDGGSDTARAASLAETKRLHALDSARWAAAAHDAYCEARDALEAGD